MQLELVNLPYRPTKQLSELAPGDTFQLVTGGAVYGLGGKLNEQIRIVAPFNNSVAMVLETGTLCVFPNDKLVYPIKTLLRVWGKAKSVRGTQECDE